MKGLLKRNDDKHIALTVYRPMPLQDLQQKCSWADDCTLNYPSSKSLWNRGVPTASSWKGRKEGLRRSDQQQNFNLWQKARDLPKLQPGDPVWIRDQNRQVQVVSRTPEPRSYLVRTDLGLCVATADCWFQHRTTVMTPTVVGHHLHESVRHLISRHRLSRSKKPVFHNTMLSTGRVG